MAYEIKPGDVAIVLSPVVEDGEWTGSIKTGMVFGSAGSEDGLRAALDEALTMFPDQYAEAEQEQAEATAYEVEDNVVTLTRWSKTQGSA